MTVYKHVPLWTKTSLEAKRTELGKIERRIKRIVELISEDDVPVRALKQELIALEERQLALQQELDSVDVPAPLLHPNLAELYRRRVAMLQDALRDPATRDEAFELIRSLIENIRLVPENGVLRVELKGQLAGILALAADGNRPGGDLSPAGHAQQIKMVAGTRNNLYRTQIYLPYSR